MDAYVRGIHENATYISNGVNSQLDKARQKQKKYYDRFINSSKVLNVGDLVLVAVYKQQVDQSRSLIIHANGPHEILEVFNGVNDKIKDVSNGRIQVMHYNNLKPYKNRMIQHQIVH
jgi:hypothetical protein